MLLNLNANFGMVLAKFPGMKRILFIALIVCISNLHSQMKKKDSIVGDDFIVIQGDSVAFTLDEVVLIKKRNFITDKEKRYYYWYWKKVHNAYPYAKLAAERLTQLNKQLEQIHSKRKRRKHIKKMQNYMENEFTAELKKMTRTEGKILIKLIDRQTGQTVYDLVKEYRSGWKAFWYNTTAKVFKLSLKSEYHPESEALDFLIEDILQRAFANGSLEEQPSKFPIDYPAIAQKFKNINIVEVIDNRDN